MDVHGRGSTVDDGLTQLDFSARPPAAESPEPMHVYIEQVPAGDIRDVLERQGRAATDLLRGVADERTLERYAPGKWSVREALGHINDCERLFSFRAWSFARGGDAPLPGFSEEVAVANAGFDDVPWTSLIDEFESLRAATVALFRHLPEEAWRRQGTANGRVVSVRALAFIAAGHVEHHLRIYRERYGL